MGNFWTKSAKWSLLDKKEIDEDWATKRNWICNDQLCPNPYTHARGDPCKLTMEDQDSEEYCEATALAEEMMRPSGSHHE
jgi:hypothetical protein